MFDERLFEGKDAEKPTEQSEVSVDALVKHACFADDIQGDCVLDNYKPGDCDHADKFHKYGGSRDGCQFWKAYKACKECGHFISYV